jgi:hypothetical protein
MQWEKTSMEKCKIPLTPGKEASKLWCRRCSITKEELLVSCDIKYSLNGTWSYWKINEVPGDLTLPVHNNEHKIATLKRLEMKS